MKQVLQYQRTGALVVQDVPSPGVRPGALLVRTRASLISAGTERTSVATAQASLIGKARSRPDLVKQVLDTVRREGLAATYRKVQARLESTKALGYSCAGDVLISESEDFRPGDRVACAGAGYASHAEVVVVPRNLCAKLPAEVPFEAGCFATLGAIAMQGVRQGDVRVGERVAVIGLGLIGQITAQILKAAGCAVLGVDLSSSKLALAEQLGAASTVLPDRDAAVAAMLRATDGRGADAVIITAGTTSNAPIELAGQLVRDRGRVVVVGAVKMDVPRSPYYEKEVEIRFSRSYGPGRYDPSYEEAGHDYPIGYVRWTEQRNMAAFLDLVASGRVRIAPLISHRFPVDEAPKAYDVVLGKTGEEPIGVVLEYPVESPDGHGPMAAAAAPAPAAPRLPLSRAPRVGFIGAGGFAHAYLLPPLQTAGVPLRAVVTASGVSATNAAKKFGFTSAASDPGAVLDDADTDLVFIATRHDSHEELVVRAVQRGKAVFVEKPLAVTETQLAKIERVVGTRSDARVMVGFNRRFSRPLIAMREHLAGRGPLTLLYRVNAGALPANHWIHEPAQGGRIIGEACHFVDALAFLSGAEPLRVYAESLGGGAAALGLRDNVSFTIAFTDGSLGTVVYAVGGAGAVGKEYVEVHGGGYSAVMDNFTYLLLASGGHKRRLKFDGEKGHHAEVLATVGAVRDGREMPIPFASLAATTRVTFAVHQSLATGMAIELA
jgi:polar amino acid transport system substrate-binding protein